MFFFFIEPLFTENKNSGNRVMFFTGNIVDMSREKNKELIILFCERFRPEAQRRLISIMITDLQRVMQLSRFYPSFYERWNRTDELWRHKARLLSCSFSSLSIYLSISLSFARSRTKMTCYSFLKRGPRCGNACDTDSLTVVHADRSKDHSRCQDRPAFEMIFGFGPGETRIAVSYNTVVNARLNSTVMNVSGRILRIYFRSASWRTLCTHNQSIC